MQYAVCYCKAMKDEGYIKFNSEWVKAEPLSLDKIKDINECRSRLYKLGLIGILEDGIGFGNISKRILETNHFVITGTQTGEIPILNCSTIEMG